MQTHERIRLEPVPARRVSPVDHHDLGAGRVDQRVGESHPRCAASDDEVVGFEDLLRHGVQTSPPPARGNQDTDSKGPPVARAAQPPERVEPGTSYDAANPTYPDRPGLGDQRPSSVGRRAEATGGGEEAPGGPARVTPAHGEPQDLAMDEFWMNSHRQEQRQVGPRPSGPRRARPPPRGRCSPRSGSRGGPGGGRPGSGRSVRPPPGRALAPLLRPAVDRRPDLLE